MLSSTFRPLGSAETARRTAEARDRGVPGNGGEVHGEAPQAPIADVADLPGEPCQATGVGGFLRGADPELQDPVRIPGPGS